MTELEKIQDEAEKLRELIREAHGATKDLRAAVKDARECYHAMTEEVLHDEWTAAQAEIARVFKDANDRDVKEIDGRLSRMIRYLTESGIVRGEKLIEREEKTGFMLFGHTKDGSTPQGAMKLK